MEKDITPDTLAVINNYNYNCFCDRGTWQLYERPGPETEAQKPRGPDGGVGENLKSFEKEKKNQY